MTLFVANKVLSLRGSSDVVNEAGEPAYIVRGKLFSPTRKKYVCDLQGNRLYTVRRKFFRLFTHKAYIYDADNNKILKLIEKFFSVGSAFYTRIYPDELTFERKVGAFNYTVSKNGVQAATVRHDFQLFGDKFCVDIAEGEDPAFFVALIIAMDNIIDARTR